jgi:hypothetical protein
VGGGVTQVDGEGGAAGDVDGIGDGIGDGATDAGPVAEGPAVCGSVDAEADAGVGVARGRDSVPHPATLTAPMAAIATQRRMSYSPVRPTQGRRSDKQGSQRRRSDSRKETPRTRGVRGVTAVEVPGIEPGSSGGSTGLLRA